MSSNKEKTKDTTFAATTTTIVCSVCHGPAAKKLQCSSCRWVNPSYVLCSKECQTMDWKRNKNQEYTQEKAGSGTRVAYARLQRQLVVVAHVVGLPLE